MTDEQKAASEPLMTLFRPVRFEFVDDVDDHQVDVDVRSASRALEDSEVLTVRSQSFRSWLSERPEGGD